MTPSSIEIDRLLIEGTEVYDPAALKRSLETELVSVFSSGDWQHYADSAPIEWKPSDGMEVLSRAIAQRIAHAIRTAQSPG